MVFLSVIYIPYCVQVFRDNNITITYSSEFDRFPPDSYIENVLQRTREEGRSEIVFVSKFENVVNKFQH